MAAEKIFNILFAQVHSESNRAITHDCKQTKDRVLGFIFCRMMSDRLLAKDKGIYEQ